MTNKQEDNALTLNFAEANIQDKDTIRLFRDYADRRFLVGYIPEKSKNWVRQLANGINPLNGSALKDDDIVNNVHISRCLFYVADLLGKYSEKKIRSDSLRTEPFAVSFLQLDKYNFVDAVSISGFVRALENLLPDNMKNITIRSATTWLVQKGMLRESESDVTGRKYKIATENGNRIGIYSEVREGERGGHYLATLYNRDAQRYLLDHIEEISQVQ